jgi:hypothetical protein
MEAEWQADRAALRDLLRTRPDLTLKAMVAQLGRSYSWGKKWAKRTPGPQAILYYLPRDTELRERGCRLPRSTSTIWRLLTRLGLLVPSPAVQHQSEPQREPLEEVQVDWHRTRVLSCLIRAARASSSTSSRFAILWTQAPRYCSRPRSMTISMPKPRWKR